MESRTRRACQPVASEGIRTGLGVPWIGPKGIDGRWCVEGGAKVVTVFGSSDQVDQGWLGGGDVIYVHCWYVCIVKAGVLG